MNANTRAAAIQWLTQKHAETKSACDAPARQSESAKEKIDRQFAESESRRELAIIDAIYNEIAGTP